MQKKIGIITFHNSVNYGAVLQTYALYRVLSDDGYDVEVIDYVNKKIDEELKSKGTVLSKSIKGYVKAAIKKYHGNRKNKSFSTFIESYIKLSEKRNVKISGIETFSDKYDIFITGSDQVWNLDITDNDMSYYLDFVSDNAKRIAYAASIGDNLNLNLSSVTECIKKFDAVSVREVSLKKHLKKTYNIDVALCCDPTLLADRSIYDQVTNKRIIRNKYIFCFIMNEKPGIIEVAKTIARDNDLIVIDNKSSIPFFLHSSPEDYLSWICNAEYIITDSFHGTVFSLLFRKQFISDKFDNKGNEKKRIIDLLEKISLSDRVMPVNIDNSSLIVQVLNKQIDYDKIEEERRKLAIESHDWLRKSISN